MPSQNHDGLSVRASCVWLLCISIYTFGHVYICKSVHMLTCLLVHGHTHTDTHICIHVYIYMSLSLSLSICIYIYAYIHGHIDRWSPLRSSVPPNRFHKKFIQRTKVSLAQTFSTASFWQDVSSTRVIAVVP